jgi:hypothetical protein
MDIIHCLGYFFPNTASRKLDLFPSSDITGGKISAQMSLERVSITGPVFGKRKTNTIDNVHNNIHVYCNTPLSETFTFTA